MEKLHVRRWAKHGHDRLYVTTASGMKVGWFDLNTQKHHLDLPGMWPEFQYAVSEWRMLPKAATPAQRRAGRSRPARDLADQSAGAALQQRAEKLRPR